jgi:hypothetical protein
MAKTSRASAAKPPSYERAGGKDIEDAALAAEKEDEPDYEELLEEARERFEHISEVDRDNRENQKSDTKFIFTPGEQWPADIRDQRKAWKEVCLEFNQLKQFVAQVVNDARQNSAGVRVHAASGDASHETAEIIQGMVRAIEYESKADAAYDNGVQGAVVGGRGWWRICSEYCSDSSFEQKLCIKPIADPLTVYADLDYQEPDGSDRNYVFVIEGVPKSDFERRWPDADPIDWDKLDSRWSVDNKNIFVADYYRRVCKKRKLVRMSDGAEGFKDEMPTPPDGVTVGREREVETWTCEWYKIAGGAQVLEKYEWPGSIIPVVCCVGEDIMLDGKRIYQGLTRHARDSQSMLNFGMTQQAIHLSLTPRAPWRAPARAIVGYENIWRDANTKNYSVLPYHDRDDMGEIAPPERTAPSTPDAGWLNWSQMMLGMVKSTIGMYENSLGMKSQEISGVATRQKESQGDNATFNYRDNRSRAIALTGRIIVENIRNFYDTERIVHTIGIDDTRKPVTINQAGVAPDPLTGSLMAIKHNDVTVGQFAVTVEAGPSYKTKRQESGDALLQFTKAFPPAAAVAGDLIVKALDVADADVLADRLKLTLPPIVQQAEAAKAKGGKPPDPAVMAEMQHLQQQLQLALDTMGKMDAENKDLKSGAAVKLQAAKVDSETKLKLADEESRVKIGTAQADANATFHVEQLKFQERVKLAELEAQTKKDIAALDNAVKLEIAEMNNAATLQAGQEQAAMAAAKGEAETEGKVKETEAKAKASAPVIHIHMPSGKKRVKTPSGEVYTIEEDGPQSTAFAPGQDGNYTPQSVQ